LENREEFKEVGKFPVFDIDFHLIGKASHKQLMIVEQTNISNFLSIYSVP